MKKIISLNLLAVWLAATAAFGQGYFLFTTGKSQAYDGFSTPGVSTLSTNVDMSFMWGPANTTPDVAAATGFASSPANGNSFTFPGYYASQAWHWILDGQFTLATNSSTGTLVSQTTRANGSLAYNSGVTFPVTGTTPGATNTVYMISWDAQYATPQLAAAANGGDGSAVGWGIPIQYTTGLNSNTTILSVNFDAFTSFGTFAPEIIPEPTMLALALLGGLSLLAFRRK